jgi:hypothetical protein
MEQFLASFPDYLLKVVISTLSQLLVLFGPLLLLAFIMSFISKLNENLSYKVLGRNGYLYVFGWRGTIIHELGHVIFAIIFGHKIIEVKWFSPAPDNETLGYVNHSYNRKNIYQCLGNFFIGIGPILLGSIILYLITYLLFGFRIDNIVNIHIASDSIKNLSSIKLVFSGILDGFLNYNSLIFSGQSTRWWKILLLIYFLYSIGSSITLSFADIKSSSIGLLYFIILLIFFNLFTLWIGGFTIILFDTISSLFSGFYFLIILSIIINCIFIIILLIINLIIKQF